MSERKADEAQVKPVLHAMMAMIDSQQKDLVALRARTANLEMRFNDLDAELLLSSKRTHPS